MSAATSHRRLLLAGAAAVYAGVFAASTLWERPGLGIAHCYYVAIALVALATGPRRGVLAGFLATGLWALGVLLNPAVPPAEIFTLGALIRLTTYAAVGALVGFYASSNQMLVERLQVEAERDFLTNLLNVRAFEAALERQVEGHRPFALVLGDMDGLRQVNDELGHAAGNEALRELAEALLEHTREGDELARVGGDEFGLLAAVTDVGEARRLVRQLEQDLVARGLRISFGCAVFPGDGETALSLFRQADARLYDRKLLRRRLVGPEQLQPASESARDDALPARAQAPGAASESGPRPQGPLSSPSL
jgi:diguanylate cyclase (GGDEF)-like protein